MPHERAGDPGHPGGTTADLAETAGPGSVDGRHLLLIGAGPGLGMAVARRFAAGGYQVTLVARSTDGLRDLASNLADTGGDTAARELWELSERMTGLAPARPAGS
jgi:NAD(P)-dependent dehydrogenase (short-subunit alcohol dehydrogenase family)